jgi:hypothetical protein
VRLGHESHWFVPYYVEFRSGWFHELASARWNRLRVFMGDAFLNYRHTYIDMGQGGLLESTPLSGPMVGVAFHW